MVLDETSVLCMTSHIEDQWVGIAWYTIRPGLFPIVAEYVFCAKVYLFEI